jgi:hypothetical protein
MTFLGQHNFSDSRDLVDDLPGDVLLIFAAIEEDLNEVTRFEWYPLGLCDLLGPSAVPVQPWRIDRCYGYSYRALSYPVARRKCQEPLTYLMYLGKPVLSQYWLFQ